MRQGNPINDPVACHKILIIEDEALVALEIERMLTAAGYRVVGVADTMDETMALAAQWHPDLALCDIRLGRESGVAVATCLKAQGVPSLFVSGNCATAEGAGVGLGCLHKPFSSGRLLSAIEVVKALMAGKVPPPLPDDMHLL